MKIVTEIETWRAIRKSLGSTSIGFVPTMGHLHAGHLSLCARSQAENEITVVSIYVNPTQFNETSDFNCYPRTIEEDQALLLTQSVDYLFLPSAKTNLYPDHYQVQVTESQLSQTVEGAFRPGHFTGMLTIVLKLLNLVQPTRAYFGEKDYQQYLLIQKMVAALFLPIEIVPCPTIRAEDGLALSSRNSRLTQMEREKAVLFPQLLNSHLTVQEIIEKLSASGFKVDYIIEKWQRRLGAVWLGDIRLIDNVIYNEN